jgi:hypothetical protein
MSVGDDGGHGSRAGVESRISTGGGKLGYSESDTPAHLKGQGILMLDSRISDAW